MNNQQINIGDTVARVFAWSADELPTDKNYRIGRVLEVTERGYEIDGIGFAPADRVILIEKGEAQAEPFAHLSPAKASAVLNKAQSKGWRGDVTAANLNRDEFEVMSDSGAAYIVRLWFSDATDEVFANCSCLYFRNTRRLCKHSALIAIDELYSKFEVRKAA